MAMLCVRSLASTSDPALCLCSQDCIWGGYFLLCQVQDSPSSKSYHTKSLRVSLGFSIAPCFHNSLCLCFPSGPGWDVSQVTADTVIL